MGAHREFRLSAVAKHAIDTFLPMLGQVRDLRSRVAGRPSDDGAASTLECRVRRLLGSRPEPDGARDCSVGRATIPSMSSPV